MTSAKLTRSDSWTPDDDAILKETVLRYIREGSTQLKAFEECGEILGRTAAACGFRWNGVLRKQAIDQINEAKSEKRETVLARKNRKVKQKDDAAYGDSMLDAVIRALKRREFEYFNLKERTNELEQKVAELEAKVFLNGLQHSDLLELLNRAKQLIEQEKQVEYSLSHHQKEFA